MGFKKYFLNFKEIYFNLRNNITKISLFSPYRNTSAAAISPAISQDQPNSISLTNDTVLDPDDDYYSTEDDYDYQGETSGLHALNISEPLDGPQSTASSAAPTTSTTTNAVEVIETSEFITL